MDNFQHFTASTLDRKHAQTAPGAAETGTGLRVTHGSRCLFYLPMCYKPGLSVFNGCSVSRQVTHNAFLSNNWCHS